MGRKKTLENQVRYILFSKQAYGESRHKAKQQLREEKGDDYRFGMTDDKIHSISTFNNYMKQCNLFVNWCMNEKGVERHTKLDDLKEYAIEYLQQGQDDGKSLYTLKLERSALAKLYGQPIPFTFDKPRSYRDVTRSRGERVRDKNFSEERNQDLVNISRGTGGRREDIGKLTSECFFHDEHGNLWVHFYESKGGRDRVSPILPQYQEKIEQFLATKKPNEPLFERIHNAADIHSYRREYAQDLYDLVCKDKEKAKEYAEQYPTRYEEGIKGDIYRSHDKEHSFEGNRDDIHTVSQALGHNRLDVTVNHYLK